MLHGIMPPPVSFTSRFSMFGGYGVVQHEQSEPLLGSNRYGFLITYLFSIRVRFSLHSPSGTALPTFTPRNLYQLVRP